jgi:phage terminase small subunit
MATTRAPKKPRTQPSEQRGVEVARARGRDTCTKEAAALVDVNKPLTDMQKEFVRHWAKGESITSASARAGFASSGIGYQLVRMPNVLAYKATFERKYEEAAQMSRKKVMDMHMEAFEMAKLMAEPASMVSAAREIGKMCGYYAPVEVKMKVDVQGNMVVGHLNALSDAELLEAITKGTMTDLPGLGYEEHVD